LTDVPQRLLNFRTFDDALAEVQRLHEGGYTRLGNWDLAQICHHCAHWMEEALDGFEEKVPWLLKVLAGRWILNSILKSRRMQAGTPTPQKPLPESGLDEVAAIARLHDAISRLQQPHAVAQESPFFGKMSIQEARELHLIHLQHHLGFLQPKA
jgi:hypothetical protein